MEQRDLFFKGDIIEQVPDGKIIHRIDDPIGISHKICSV